jgi:hypothetical protein
LALPARRWRALCARGSADVRGIEPCSVPRARLLVREKLRSELQHLQVTRGERIQMSAGHARRAHPDVCGSRAESASRCLRVSAGRARPDVYGSRGVASVSRCLRVSAGRAHPDVCGSRGVASASRCLRVTRCGERIQMSAGQCRASASSCEPCSATLSRTRSPSGGPAVSIPTPYPFKQPRSGLN